MQIDTGFSMIGLTAEEALRYRSDETFRAEVHAAAAALYAETGVSVTIHDDTGQEVETLEPSYFRSQRDEAQQQALLMLGEAALLREQVRDWQEQIYRNLGGFDDGPHDLQTFLNAVLNRVDAAQQRYAIALRTAQQATTTRLQLFLLATRLPSDMSVLPQPFTITDYGDLVLVSCPPAQVLGMYDVLKGAGILADQRIFVDAAAARAAISEGLPDVA